MMLVGVTAALVATVLALTLGRSVGVGSLVAGAISALMVPALLLVSSRQSPAVLGLGVSIWTLVVVASGVLATAVFDGSWDGRDYQQFAIHEIAEGFNPIRETAVPQDFYRNLELNHYPKAPWYLGATLAGATDRIETAKTLNFLLAWAAACLAFLALETRPWASLTDSVLLTGLVALNPVISAQLFTHYVDGLGASVVTMLLALSVLHWVAPRHRNLVCLGLVLLIGLNIKFTVTALLGVLLPVIMGALLWRHRNAGVRRRLAVVVTSATVVGLAVLGYSPYVRNAVEQGHPLYPTLGSNHDIGAANILATQISPEFLAKSRPERVLVSLFSRSQNDPTSPVAAFKAPYRVSRSEFRSFVSPDVRIGGFGPLFGAVTILALTGLTLGASRQRRMVGTLMVVLAAPVLLHDGGWWARFSPQLWLLPMLALAVPWGEEPPGRSASILLRGARTLALILLSTNALGVAYVSWSNALSTTNETKSRLAELRQLSASGRDILIYQSVFVALSYKLEESGIPFHLVGTEAELPCPQPLSGGTAFSPATCDPATAARE
jgi:hypothetical protein